MNAHDIEVRDLANDYWLDASWVQRSIAEGITLPASVCGLICAVRRVSMARGNLRLTPEMTDEIIFHLIRGVDEAIQFYAEQDVTRQEVA